MNSNRYYFVIYATFNFESAFLSNHGVDMIGCGGRVNNRSNGRVY